MARATIENAAWQRRWALTSARWFEAKLIFRPSSRRVRLCGSLRVKLVRNAADKTRVRIEARAPTRARADRALRELLTELNQPTEKPTTTEARRSWIEPLTTRVLVVAILVAALVAAIALGTPTKCVPRNLLLHGPTCSKGDVAVPDLPSFAFGQPTIYHVEIAVLVVFAGLLIATPVVRAIFRGEMPLEVSTEGIKFGEPALLADDHLQESVEKIGSRLSVIEPIVSELRLRLEQSESDTGAS